MKTYRGQRKRRYCVEEDSRGVITTVYLEQKTVITTITKTGSVQVVEQPP